MLLVDPDGGPGIDIDKNIGYIIFLTKLYAHRSEPVLGNWNLELNSKVILYLDWILNFVFHTIYDISI